MPDAQTERATREAVLGPAPPGDIRPPPASSFVNVGPIFDSLDGFALNCPRVLLRGPVKKSIEVDSAGRAIDPQVVTPRFGIGVIAVFGVGELGISNHSGVGNRTQIVGDERLQLVGIVARFELISRESLHDLIADVRCANERVVSQPISRDDGAKPETGQTHTGERRRESPQELPLSSPAVRRLDEEKD